MVSFKLTATSGIITLVAGAIVAALDYVVQNSPQYAAEAGFVVAVLTAFISFENQTTTAA